MSKINLLDSAIFNRIAAGEVVECPASVVKELIENAIDAKATRIDVTIAGGGIERINIIDNGVGMEKGDLEKAFLAHATSKIADVKDLERISTLGFRGEALPSIASVSEVTMQSCAEGSNGCKIDITNGTISQVVDCGCAYGSSITVSNLFENVPARKKFLGDALREENKIISVVNKLILSNPNIAISFKSERKFFESAGDGILSSIFTVYGKEAAENMLEISDSEQGVRVYGFVGRPTYSRHNKNLQTLIVNGRVVENNDVYYSIFSAYASYLMTRQYPVYAVYIDLPYDMVDVNVHPNKLQVKFANLTQIKSLVSKATKNAVNSSLNMPLQRTTSDASAPTVNDTFFRIFNAPQPNNTTFRNSTEIEMMVAQTVRDMSRQEQASCANQNGTNIEKSGEYSKTYVQETVLSEKKPQYTGKLFQTYLIFQSDDCFYLIDQHAAHEKLLYDKLQKQYEQKATLTQDLLMPFTFFVTSDEATAFLENSDFLKECGFVIMPLTDDSMALCTVPMICSGIDCKTFIADITQIMKTRDKQPQTYKNSLMQAACKAAVKGGVDDLSESEVYALIDALAADNIALFCPHGRPLVIKIDKEEVEKWFKRIG